MSKTRGMAVVLAWMAALVIGTLLALGPWDRVFFAGGVHPLGYDSFYHLTRILAVAADPGSLYQFDPNLNWPHGLWIVWPWGYDYAIGLLAGALSNSPAGAASVAMFVPVALLWVNVTLVALLARELLRPLLAALAVLAFAAAPATLANHMLGNIDHHAAEQTMWLLALYLAAIWCKRPGSTPTAVALGMALGSATAFHNGLFLLQAPVLLALLASRLLAGQIAPRRAVAAFCVALLATQLLVLIPSHHFREWTYQFYHLSWFHLHVAALTCVGTAAMTLRSSRSMWMMLGVGAILALPALPQVLYGMNFMGARLQELTPMQETNSPFWGELPLMRVTELYSGLIWLTPLLMAWALVTLFRERTAGVRLGVLVFSIVGMLLMALQIRFYQFGSVFLVLLPLLAIQGWFARPRDVFYGLLLLAGAFSLSISAYGVSPVVGKSPRYAMGFRLIESLEEACNEEPGLLLADQNWGNLLRYRTRCPLIATNFIMTEKDFEALERSRALLSLDPQELREAAPEVRYVLAFRSEQNVLGYSLMFRPLPPGFEPLEVLHDPQGVTIGAAYRVLPDATQADTGEEGGDTE